MSITLLEYYGRKAAEINDRAFEGIRTRADWEKQRDELRLHYFHSLGLDGAPRRPEVAVREHGTLKGPGYTARKISFPILPDCWGSGIVFYPDPLPAPKNPAVLYLCGHANFGILDYHPHAILWARKGYVCLIIDCIRQADNTGDHSAFSRGGRMELISLGYTAAGGEFLNCWGALNALCDLPEVDTARVGATGLSGGGAHCFFLAVADERVKAVASTCGVVSLKHTIRNRHFDHNCDCMFWHNPYQVDTSVYGALIAPRPLLLAHARGDYLFTPAENQDLHGKMRRIYELYGAPEKCELFQFDGPHSYQPSSVKAINDWFDRHLKPKLVVDLGLGGAELAERQCTVWNGDHPIPDRLDILPEILTPPRSFPIPDTLEELGVLRARLVKQLEERVFHDVATSRETIEMQPIHVWKLDPVKPYPLMRKWRGVIGGMELWITQHMPSADVKDILVILCDQEQDDMAALGSVPLRSDKVGIVTIEPRAGGLNAPSAAMGRSLLKLGMYLGVTPITLWMKDLKEVLGELRRMGELEGKNVYLYGQRDAGTAALYHTVLDQTVAGVIIHDIWSSHWKGGHIPHILKVLDVEQALGLVAPRVIGLDTKEWEFVFWSVRLYERLGIRDRFVHTHSMAHTLGSIFRG